MILKTDNIESVVMGSICQFEETLPKQVLCLPVDNRKIKFQIQYCAGLGSKRQADYALKIIQTLFPKAKIKLASRSPDERVIVNANGVKVYDSILEGYLFEETAENFAKCILQRA